MKKMLLVGFILTSCAVILIGYAYFNYQFWTHVKTENFKVLVEFKGSNIKGLRGRQILIHKDFEKYMNVINDYAADNEIELIVNQGYRNKDESILGSIVTPAKSSNHLAGFAIDFNIQTRDKLYLSAELKRANYIKLPQNIRKFLDAIRGNSELRWGGDFQKEDPIHIDYPLNLSDKNKWLNSTADCSLDYSNRIPKWKFWVKQQ